MENFWNWSPWIDFHGGLRLERWQLEGDVTNCLVKSSCWLGKKDRLSAVLPIKYVVVREVCAVLGLCCSVQLIHTFTPGFIPSRLGAAPEFSAFCRELSHFGCLACACKCVCECVCLCPGSGGIKKCWDSDDGGRVNVSSLQLLYFRHF